MATHQIIKTSNSTTSSDSATDSTNECSYCNSINQIIVSAKKIDENFKHQLVAELYTVCADAR